MRINNAGDCLATLESSVIQKEDFAHNDGQAPP